MNIVIVTGITSGLGRSLHDYLVEHWAGYKIFLSREEYSGNDDRSYIKQNYKVFDFEAINSHIIGNIENIIFINNASTIYPIKKSMEISMDDFQDSINVNYKFPAALASMLAMKAQSLKCRLLIFNITSGAANRAVDGWVAYCSTKSAIKMVFEVMALEYDHVDCVHYDPGVMDTPMQEYIRNVKPSEMKDVSRYLDYKDDKVLKDPKDVATDVMFEVTKFLS